METVKVKCETDKQRSGLKRLQILERVLALFCISIPVLLWLADDQSGWRGSISGYAYMSRSYLFGLVLTVAAMMFIFNGILYYDKAAVSGTGYSAEFGRWYNIILGLALLGVVLVPYGDSELFHYAFAGIFFLGGALCVALFSEKRHNRISVCIAVLSVVGLAAHYAFDGLYSLLVGEWIALAVLAVHYFLESIGVVTLTEVD